MPDPLIKKLPIDLDILIAKPLLSEEQNKGNCIALPDMHGNTLKLLQYLHHLGVIKNLTTETYSKLHRTYNQPWDFLNENENKERTRQLTNHWDDLIEGLEFNPKAVGHLILIGDTLGDRGNNDYLTESLISALFKKGPSSELIMSNHDHVNLSNDMKPSITPTTSWNNAQTSNQANRDKHLDYRKEILKNVKLLSYNLTDGGKNIEIYSHAMIPDIHGNLSELAQELGVEYKGKDAVHLAATIERINIAFRDKYIIKYYIYQIPNTTKVWKFFWRKKDATYGQGKDYPYTYRNADEKIPPPWAKVIHGHDKKATGGVNLDEDNDLAQTSWDGRRVLTQNIGELIYSQSKKGLICGTEEAIRASDLDICEKIIIAITNGYDTLFDELYKEHNKDLHQDYLLVYAANYEQWGIVTKIIEQAQETFDEYALSTA